MEYSNEIAQEMSLGDISGTIGGLLLFDYYRIFHYTTYGLRTFKMKQLFIVIVTLLLCTAISSAQFKSNAETNVSQSLVRTTSGNALLGFLNMDNFSMRHSVGFNYTSIGGSSVSLASYTNSMKYKISDPLNMRVDLTLQGSPFGNQGLFAQDNLNKLYVSRAELNYHPSQNFYIQVQYRELPMNYWGMSPFSPYSSLWGDQ